MHTSEGETAYLGRPERALVRIHVMALGDTRVRRSFDERPRARRKMAIMPNWREPGQCSACAQGHKTLTVDDAVRAAERDVDVGERAARVVPLELAEVPVELLVGPRVGAGLAVLQPRPLVVVRRRAVMEPVIPAFSVWHAGSKQEPTADIIAFMFVPVNAGQCAMRVDM